ncbi:MAG: sulfatase-like hydrolase/transferase [Halobacteriales archaeon]
MRDVILVTADSVRYDFIDAMDYVSGFDRHRGITPGHYTRPSLAGLLSASYRGAIESRAVGPTVASAFSDTGYTTIGLSSSPHTDPRFGFDAGFDAYENYSDAGNRGNPLRQFASRFDLLRRLYHRVRPPHAKLSNRLPDGELIDNAVSAFNDRTGPRFMWLHLMGTHRPYGLGEDAVPRDIDRRALFDPGSLTDAQQATIEERYRATLSRADDEIRRLLAEIDSEDPLVVFTSDHGDEFGEEGHYFHQPQRRRVADALTTVPVATNGLELPEPLSLVDVGPTVLGSVGAPGAIPEAWHGRDVRGEPRNHALTIAPWNGTATVAWQDFETKIVSEDANVRLSENGESVGVERRDIDEDLKRQMRELGYAE